MIYPSNLSVKASIEQNALSGGFVRQSEKKLNVFPVSFAQQQMWVLDQLAPGTSTYTIAGAFRLQGNLDQAALRAALQELVERHEALRTVFPSVQGRPLQQVQEAPAFQDLPLESLTGWPVEARTAMLMQRLREEEARPFNLATGPLFRPRLFCLQEQEHILLICVHHIVFDGWSFGILLDELAQLYTASRAGRPSLLAPLSLQYASYARWQRSRLQGSVLEELLTFWKARLSPPLPVLELPLDRPRLQVQSFAGAEYAFSLPLPLAQQLHRLSRQKGVTLFMTLLAAWNVLLFRYSGQTDICVGTPVANRTHPEIERLIGCFINTLAVRSDLAGGPSFSQVLSQVGQNLLDAYAHQELPFEKLIEELSPQRDLSRHPLFQVMFVLQNEPASPISLPDLEVQALALPISSAKLDLTCILWEKAEGLDGCFEYNTTLFDQATIARMSGHYQTLLESLVAQPDLPITDLPLLTTAEQIQLLVEWNPLQLHNEQKLCLHQLFEAQAARTPHALALTFEGQHFNYQQLDQRANQLAHILQRLGVGPNVLVGLYLERSPQLLVALLGILKAGGAYVPLDPAYPPERIAFMLQDAQVPVLVTQPPGEGEGKCKALPLPACKVVSLDSEWEVLSQESCEPVLGTVQPDDLAYVIYTSGSTGQPKGVKLTHANVTRLFSATESSFHFDEHDVWTLFHSCAFDFSVWEIWGAWLYGGRLVVVPYLTSRSPEAFLQLLVRERVTVLNQTPSAFRQLIQVEEQLREALALRLVIFGGEALDLQSLRPWFERHGDRRPQLINMYGITETTVHVTFRPLTLDDLDDGLGSVIGRPLSDLQIYLLDSSRQLVPIGVPGEIYVGGAGVAQGYLNRPELTSDRFLPDPFQPGGQLYKSGDLARWLPTGELEYLGRIDHQVKIRGFRIEMGEIETLLCQYPGIKGAVVLAREDEAGTKTLVAYLVAQQPPTTSALRAFLKEYIPDYMVPSVFVFLASFPLTTNGKIDRRALPEPGVLRPALEGEYVAPRTSDEESVAHIWARVLGLDRVGVFDNFFDLGGHSFSAVRLTYEIEKALGKRLPVAAIFQAPTVEQFALLLAGSQHPDHSPMDSSSLIPLRSAGKAHPLICLHPIGGNVLCYAALMRHLCPDRPVFGVAAAGLHDQISPDVSIDAMARRYAQILVNSHLPEPYLLLGWSMGGIIALEMALQLHRQWKKDAHVLLLDSRVATFDTDIEWDDAALVAGFAEDWGRSSGCDLGLREEELQGLTPDQMTAYLLLKAARAGAPETDAAYIGRLLEVFKANAFALRGYRPAIPHNGRLVLFSAEDAPMNVDDPTDGWGLWSEGAVEVLKMSGDHYEMMKEPHVIHLARAIERCLGTWGF